VPAPRRRHAGRGGADAAARGLPDAGGHDCPDQWWLTNSSTPEEVFVHEWMHQVVFFHERFQRTNIDLHAGERYGYAETNGSWKPWLVDVMQGKVRDGNRLIGISKDIWAAGKPTAP
jgi:hypothetical protein